MNDAWCNPYSGTFRKTKRKRGRKEGSTSSANGTSVTFRIITTTTRECVTGRKCVWSIIAEESSVPVPFLLRCYFATEKQKFNNEKFPNFVADDYSGQLGAVTGLLMFRLGGTPRLEQNRMEQNRGEKGREGGVLNSPRFTHVRLYSARGVGGCNLIIMHWGRSWMVVQRCT